MIKQGGSRTPNQIIYKEDENEKISFIDEYCNGV